MAKLRVAVLFGGASKDHAVSLRSAYAVLNGLSEAKYDVVPVGITKAGRWLYFPGDYAGVPDGTWENDPDCCSAVLSPDPLHKGLIKLMDENYSFHRVDVVFPVLHGHYGECGQIQALCKLSGIGYVGSGFEAANACSDKMLTHLVLNKAGIKTAAYYYLERVDIDGIESKFGEIEAKINYPMYVKAASCSPSIGANVAHNREELKAAIKIAFSHHHKIIIEEPVHGRELECVVWGSVYAPKISGIAEVQESGAVQDNAYVAKTVRLVLPAEVEPEIKSDIEKTAKIAFLALGCKNYARICFKVNENGLYCRRVNNMPGLTEQNILARLISAGGDSYGDFLDALIESAREN